MLRIPSCCEIPSNGQRGAPLKASQTTFGRLAVLGREHRLCIFQTGIPCSPEWWLLRKRRENDQGESKRWVPNLVLRITDFQRVSYFPASNSIILFTCIGSYSSLPLINKLHRIPDEKTKPYFEPKFLKKISIFRLRGLEAKPQGHKSYKKNDKRKRKWNFNPQSYFLVGIADGQPVKVGERWEWRSKLWWLVKGSNRCSFVNFQFIFDPLSRWAKGLKDGQRQHSCPSVRILTNLSKVSKSSVNQQEIGNTDTDKAEERWTDTKFVDNKILLPNPKASGNTLDLQLVKTVRPYERQTKLTNAMTV